MHLLNYYSNSLFFFADRFTLDYKKDEKLVLPTAPKAARGPDVDLAKVPSNPPFTAFLGNLPYDVSEEDISFFFRQLEVIFFSLFMYVFFVF